jgi:toxin-antitoxin system PIN domain toxin
VTFLLDVNVIVALIDPGHVSHDAAHAWFISSAADSWATCPIVENGVIRIVGHPRYPNTPGSPATVAAILSEMFALPGHAFWPDDLSLVGTASVEPAQIRTPGQVTDTYLLALAQSHGAQLATFDRRLSTSAVRDGDSSLRLISA